ncbi:glycosyltransferase [Butyricimonas virosa]|uniref:glycosyltransferase n=1 Tax=Butyricimonas virosa TaxID=544645 RepID=UPI002A9EB1AC|nr:glycosyltransferase [Butyricimonas virosa]MDY5489759.1 glycosyltransferase [Butyricimonas virosa]
MKIVFLLTHIPNPRMNKRIGLAKLCGEVVVICVRRTSQDVYEPYYGDVVHEIINIDLPPSKYIFQRILASSKYSNIAGRLLEKYNPEMIYTEGLDSLAIASRYKKKSWCKIIYEVADLRECFIELPHSAVSRLLTYIIKKQELCLFKYVDNLVVTSEKFYDMHYYRLISKDKLIFMPNIPDDEPLRKYVKKSGGVFTIGFIGGIRYLKQMKMLVDAAKTVGCNVLFAGAGETNDDYKQITDYCKDKEYVTFTGKYIYNTDIAKLYGMVDCVYAVYDAGNPNVKIALPNKLYEAVRCCLPIIVAKGTYLSEIVEEWRVGISVSHHDVNDLSRGLKQMMDKTFRDLLINNCKIKSCEIINDKYNAELKKYFL